MTDERSPGREREQWQVGDLFIDLGRQRVEQQGREIELPPLSFRLLLELARAAPDVVSLDQLMDRVWPGLVVSPDTITQRVKLLREALGDSAQNPRYVQGLRGRGYVLMPKAIRVANPVAPPRPGDGNGDALSSTGNQPELSTQPDAALLDSEPAELPTSISRRWKAPVLLVTLLTLVCLGTWTFLSRATVEANAKPRLAVVPFRSLDDDQDTAFYAVGISEELLGILGKIPGLYVFAAPGSDEGGTANFRSLGTTLGASHVLSGSVRFSDRRLRVLAHLLRTDTGEQIWSQSYERPFEDLLQTQKEIAMSVGSQLSVTLGESMDHFAPVQPEAHQRFLQAEYLFQRNDPGSISSAMTLLHEALELEPEYAAAWDRLATGYEFEAMYGQRPAGEAFALARSALTRALAIDPNLGLAHTRLGAISMFYDRDLAVAAKHMARGLALSPQTVLVNGRVGMLLKSLGRPQAALRFARFADQLGPVSLRGKLVSANVAVSAGEYDLATKMFNQVLTLNPQTPLLHYSRGVLLLLQNQPDRALAEMELETDAVRKLRGLCISHFSLGHEAQSIAAHDALLAAHAEHRASAYAVATALAWRNQTDDAFAWLDKAANDPQGEFDRDFADLVVEPLFKNLYDDPRWKVFLTRMGRSPAQLAAIEFDPPPPADLTDSE